MNLPLLTRNALLRWKLRNANHEIEELGRAYARAVQLHKEAVEEAHQATVMRRAAEAKLKEMTQ